MLESQLAKKVKKICLEHNIMCYFVQPVAGSEGVPDCILKLPNGDTIHLELKVDTRLRPAQKLFLSISNNAWECRWNSKSKKIEVILDSNIGKVVELPRFLKEQL